MKYLTNDEEILTGEQAQEHKNLKKTQKIEIMLDGRLLNV